MKLDRGIVAALGAAALFGRLSIVLTARAIALGQASILRPRGGDDADRRKNQA